MPRHASHITTNNPSRPKQRPPPNDSITARKEDNDRQLMASAQQMSAKRMTANAQQGRQRQPRPERRPAATSGSRQARPRPQNDGRPNGRAGPCRIRDVATKRGRLTRDDEDDDVIVVVVYIL